MHVEPKNDSRKTPKQIRADLQDQGTTVSSRAKWHFRKVGFMVEDPG